MLNALEIEYTRHLVSSFDKQLYLCDLIGERGWHFDTASGRICFEKEHHWCVQFLGIESADMGSWLWAWNTDVSRLPDPLCADSRVLKTLGEQQQIPELSQPQVPLSQIDGHALALIASGVCKANAYYRCPYESGALFVLIKDSSFPICTEQPLQRIASIFSKAIGAFEIPDQKFAFTSYLGYYGLSIEQDGIGLIVKDSSGSMLTASFDELRRLTHLEVKVLPPGATDTRETWDQLLVRRMLGW